jgi:uncharacterized protein YbaR (Trm112 family)
VQRTALDLLVCPSCRGSLDYAGTDEKTLLAGILTRSRCNKEYPIEDGIPPIGLVPNEMLETRVFDVWKGWLYCTEFRKP